MKNLDKFEEGVMHLVFDQGVNEWRILNEDTLGDINFLDFMSKNCDLVFQKIELEMKLQHVLSKVREGHVKISVLTDDINGDEVKSACLSFLKSKRGNIRRWCPTLHKKGFESLIGKSKRWVL